LKKNKKTVKTQKTKNSETCETCEIYDTEYTLLIFSWSDTCWEHRIWRVDTSWFC